jgi:maltose alpha-D-glucosyltransferase/alpha-amylase
MPPINRGTYSFEFVNVEDAENDPHSLLHFMRRLIALRQQHKEVFGRGSIELLPIENQSVFAFLREHEGEQMLVVANLSRFAQSFHLPADEDLEGFAPIELFSQDPFPSFGDEPYHMVLGPHGFYWFKLEPEDEIQRRKGRRSGLQTAALGPNGTELPVLHVPEGLQNLLVPTMARGRSPEAFETLLPDFIHKQRWFGAKDRDIASVEVEDAVRLRSDPATYLSVLKVTFAPSGEESFYTLPLRVAWDDEAEAVLEDHPDAVISWLRVHDRDDRGLVYDATASTTFWSVFFQWWQSGSKGRSLKGVYVADSSTRAQGEVPESVDLLTGEQSNTAAIVNGDYFFKLYRRLEEGTNPEKELLDHLTEVDFTFAPRLHGTIDFRRSDRQYTLGVLQEALPVETDGWSYALDATTHFLDRVANTKFPREEVAPLQNGQIGPSPGESAPVWLEEVAPEMISLARVLGIRTGEMHRALARAEAPDLCPVPSDDDSGAQLATRIREEAHTTRTMLDAHDDLAPSVLPPIEAWDRAMDRIDNLTGLGGHHARIRIHGDYHLGQVLRADGDFYILDFEGEPARPIEERRRRENALRDVAGMLRSLEYAVLAAWQDHTETDDAYADWVDALLRWADATFLDAYADTVGDADFVPPTTSRYDFLWAYLFDKALYEVRYELNHRPSWAWLPLRGLRRLLGDQQHPAATVDS